MYCTKMKGGRGGKGRYNEERERETRVQRREIVCIVAKERNVKGMCDEYILEQMS